MKEYVLTLTEQDINVLGVALGNMPYVQVVAVLNKINAQITAQNQPKEPANV